LNERIKQLRKELGLNQTEFGKRIGIKQGSVAGYENGIRIPLNAIIGSICKEFNVNELWLRTGEGEMFRSIDTNEDIGIYIEELLLNTDDKVYNAIKSFLNVYGQLNDTSKEILNDILDRFVNEYKKEQR